MINRIFQLVVLFSIASFFTACKDDDDIQIPNIVELAQSDSELSSLVAAVQKAGLVDALSGTGPFTVFAPTNTAFNAFLSANGFASLDEVPDALLTQVLLNHVLGTSKTAAQLSTGYENTLGNYGSTTSSIKLYVNTTGGVTLNGGPKVTTADLNASNGVVHKIDAVIGLPTITTFAASNPDFSILVAALTRSDLSANYATVLSGTGPFTVFAPTNAAFAALLTELSLNELADIPAATLEAVLQYHVVGSANVLAGSLTNNQTVTSLGGDFTITLTGGPKITDGQGRVSDIVATDVQASNGVIHVINKVILP